MATEVYTLKIEGYLANQYRANVMHFLGTGVDTNDTRHAALDCVSMFNTHLLLPWLAMLPGTYEVLSLYSRRTRLKPSAFSRLVYFPGTQPGTRGSQSTAQQTNPMIFMVPMMGFQSGGKLFLPAVSQGDLINNQYQAAFITAVQTFMAAAIGGNAGPSYTWKLQVYSHKLGTTSDIAT